MIKKKEYQDSVTVSFEENTVKVKSKNRLIYCSDDSFENPERVYQKIINFFDYVDGDKLLKTLFITKEKLVDVLEWGDGYVKSETSEEQGYHTISSRKYDDLFDVSLQIKTRKKSEDNSNIEISSYKTQINFKGELIMSVIGFKMKDYDKIILFLDNHYFDTIIWSILSSN